MKRALSIAVALTLITAGAAAAQDHREGEHEHGAPHPQGAPHGSPPGDHQGPGVPPGGRQGPGGPPDGRQGASGPPGDFRGVPPAQGYRAGPPGAGFHGGPALANGRFDGFRGQGLGPHGPSQAFYHGRSFNSFHAAPFYYPGGWGYRRWGVGQYLPGLFLTETYFIGDWAGYGLAPPPPGLQWVRYGPDALLVNVYTGQVVDTVYGAFWW